MYNVSEIILGCPLYAYFNMGRHYIGHYFTPSESEV